MKYRTDIKSGNQLSIIGFGCMRFPRNMTRIDLHRTEKIIVKAVEEGVNYFDTAYSYSGSEDALGQILAKNNLRDKIFLPQKCRIQNVKHKIRIRPFENSKICKTLPEIFPYLCRFKI